MTQAPTGIDVGGRVIDLVELTLDLETGGVPVPYGLSVVGPPPPTTASGMPILPPPPEYPMGTLLFTADANGSLTDLPPEAVPIVEAYTPHA